MTLLTNYNNFLERVEELGFMALSNIHQGFPSLSAETPEDLWHTGLETDPWRWKDRAAQEKKLAYGCILGGHKGFVTARTYPIFYAAYHPQESMSERWSAGIVNQTTWRLWQLFEQKDSLNTSQARKLLGAPPKKGGSQVDIAVQELQREYYITVSGNEQKVSADGRLYGWPSNIYSRVHTWIPAEWLSTIKDWHPSDARDQILNDVMMMSKVSDLNEVKHIFRL